MCARLLPRFNVGKRTSTRDKLTLGRVPHNLYAPRLLGGTVTNWKTYRFAEICLGPISKGPVTPDQTYGSLYDSSQTKTHISVLNWGKRLIITLLSIFAKGYLYVDAK